MASTRAKFLAKSSNRHILEHSKEQAKPVFLVCVRVPVDAVRTARVDRFRGDCLYGMLEDL